MMMDDTGAPQADGLGSADGHSGQTSCPDPSGAIPRAVLEQAWVWFLDANPDDLTSPEDLPDHALVTFEQFVGIVREAETTWYETSGESAEQPRISTALDMCPHGADRGSYCGYCGGYSNGRSDDWDALRSAMGG